MNIKRYSKDMNILKVKRVKGSIEKNNNRHGGGNMNSKIEALQKRLSANMNKAIILAEKNCIRNEQGHVVLAKDDEWRDEDEWEI